MENTKGVLEIRYIIANGVTLNLGTVNRNVFTQVFRKALKTHLFSN